MIYYQQKKLERVELHCVYCSCFKELEKAHDLLSEMYALHYTYFIHMQEVFFFCLYNLYSYSQPVPQIKFIN